MIIKKRGGPAGKFIHLVHSLLSRQKVGVYHLFKAICSVHAQTPPLKRHFIMCLHSDHHAPPSKVFPRLPLHSVLAATVPIHGCLFQQAAIAFAGLCAISGVFWCLFCFLTAQSTTACIVGSKKILRETNFFPRKPRRRPQARLQRTGSAAGSCRELTSM